MWRTSELWVVTALSVFVLSILITVGGVRQKDFEDDARTTELLESFSQVRRIILCQLITSSGYSADNLVLKINQISLWCNI